MTRDNSPYYAAGREDGADDRVIVESCPGGLAPGMNPDMSWSVMYRRGYEEAFAGAMRHVPCRRCTQGKDRQ